MPAECPRCGGRLIVLPPDLNGSDTSCLSCGCTPLDAHELAVRQRAAESEAAAQPLYPRQRKREPSFNGMRL